MRFFFNRETQMAMHARHVIFIKANSWKLNIPAAIEKESESVMQQHLDRVAPKNGITNPDYVSSSS